MVLRWPTEDDQIPFFREALIHFYESAFRAPDKERLNLKPRYDGESGVVEIDISFGSAPSAVPSAPAKPSPSTVHEAKPERAPAGTEIFIDEGWSPAQIADAVTFPDYFNVNNAMAEINYEFNVLSAAKDREKVKAILHAASHHLRIEVDQNGKRLAVHSGDGLTEVLTHFLQFAKDNIGPRTGVRAFIEDYGVRVEVSGEPATTDMSTLPEGRPAPGTRPAAPEDPLSGPKRACLQKLKAAAKALEDLVDVLRKPRPLPTDKDLARASALVKQIEAGNHDIRDKSIMSALRPSDILHGIYVRLVQPVILLALPESDPLREVWDENMGQIQRRWPRLPNIDEHLYGRKMDRERLKDMRTIQLYERITLSPAFREIEAEMNRRAGIPSRPH
jgi:hypothetical protein